MTLIASYHNCQPYLDFAGVALGARLRVTVPIFLHGLRIVDQRSSFRHVHEVDGVVEHSTPTLYHRQ